MKKRVLAAAVLAAGLANAERFYWTGAAADGNRLASAGNWAMESGSAAPRAPGKGDTVVFTNDTALSVTKTADLNYLQYEFRGANVALPKGSGSKRQYGHGGGGILATSGTHTFGYPFELNAGNFAGADKTFLVDVAAGATVKSTDIGTLKLNSPACLVKRGAGRLEATSVNPTSQVTTPGKMIFEAGTIWTEYPEPRINTWGEFEVTGPETKTYQVNASYQRISKYVESPDASKTLTFQTVAGKANTYYVELFGPHDVPRFSANFTAQTACDSHLIWNPTGGANTITMVDRVWNASEATISVKGGTMRFADGAGIRGLKALKVMAGATLEIASSASMMFSGAPVALETGATLRIEGAEMSFNPKSVSYDGVAVPEGRYTAADLGWLEGDGVLIVSAKPVGQTFCWTGAAGMTVTAAGSWRYANGAPVTVVPGLGDSVVFTNDTAITISKEVGTSYLNWSFLGKGVDFNPCSDRFYCYAGGALNALGSGTVTLRHTVELQNKVAGQFAAGDRYTFNVGAGVTVRQVSTGTVNLNSPATAVKTGAGTFTGRFNTGCSGTLAVQEGTCVIAGVNNDEIRLGCLLLEGPAAKTVRIDALPLRIVRYSEDADAEATCLFSYYGVERALTLACAEDTRLTADLLAEANDGVLRLVWAPSDTTRTLTYARRVLNRPRTKIVVQAGTLRFAEGGGAKELKTIDVAAGAALEVAADAAADFGVTPVTLAAGATLRLDGAGARLVRFPSLTVDGTAIPDGNYTKADWPDWLEGDAVLVVGAGATTAATWTGNGGADTSIDNPANWGAAGATDLPDLTGGSLVATIPAGTSLSVPSGKAFALKGIVLEAAPGAGCTIGGAGSLGLGAEGLSITGGGTATIDCTVELLLDQVWELGTQFGTCLVLERNAGIVGCGHAWNVHTSYASFKGENITSVDIRCANPLLNDSTFNCGVRVRADGALGGPDANVTINAGTGPRVALQMSGCRLTNGRVTITKLGTSTVYRSIATDTGACTIDGDLAVESANYNYTALGTGAPLTVKGNCFGTISPNLVRMALPVFDGYDLAIEKAVSENKLCLSKAGVVRLGASSNVIRRGTFLASAGAKIVTTADEAFGFGTALSAVSGVGFTAAGTWDLAGTHQSLQMLAGAGRGVITSESAATLVLDASKDFESDHGTGADAAPSFNLKLSDDAKVFVNVDEKTAQLTDHVSFQGQVSFEKKGAKPHYQGGVSTSTGALTVSEGRLVFLDGAQWRTASSVNVTGTGVLEVEGDGLLSAATPISVEGDETGRLVIPAGKTLRCRSLSVNGVDFGDGTVVSSGVVTGGGSLRVGKFGFAVIVR